MSLPSQCDLLALLLLMPLISCSPYDPHSPGSVSSWFEGWYLRVVVDPAASDPGAPASFGAIAGYTPHALPGWNATLVELLLQPPTPGAQLQASPSNKGPLAVTAGGGSPQSDPDSASPPDFGLEAPGGRLLWRMKGDACGVAVQSGDNQLSMECLGAPVVWGGEGPEGLASLLPSALTGLHWFVHSLGTPVNFTLKQRSKDGMAASTVSGRGAAHMEKNWGLSFPRGYLWAQGLELGRSGSSSPVQASFALAGGELPSPWVPASWLPDALLLGVRTPSRSWDLRPWNTIFTVQSSPCASPLLPNSTLNVTALQPLRGREVRIEISAPPESFAVVDCPTQSGFRPFSVQSYTATATLRLFQWELNLRGEKEWLQKRLLEALTLQNVALEYGGDRRCQQRSSEAEGEKEGAQGSQAQWGWAAAVARAWDGGGVAEQR